MSSKCSYSIVYTYHYTTLERKSIILTISHSVIHLNIFILAQRSDWASRFESMHIYKFKQMCNRELKISQKLAKEKKKKAVHVRGMQATDRTPTRGVGGRRRRRRQFVPRAACMHLEWALLLRRHPDAPPPRAPSARLPDRWRGGRAAGARACAGRALARSLPLSQLHAQHAIDRQKEPHLSSSGHRRAAGSPRHSRALWVRAEVEANARDRARGKWLPGGGGGCSRLEFTVTT